MQQNGVRANIVCKYFKEGNCFRGEACLFSHDLGMENICRFYLQGSCAFGNHCRYTHQRHPNKKNLQKLEMDPKINTSGSSVKQIVQIHSRNHGPPSYGQVIEYLLTSQW